MFRIGLNKRRLEASPSSLQKADIHIEYGSYPTFLYKHSFRFMARAENVAMVLLKEIRCKRCGSFFYVCHSCWRGQAYCCKLCRKTAQREAHRKAQEKYRQTEKGKIAHRRQEKERRSRNSEKTVDDDTSTPSKTNDSLCVTSPSSHPCCCFCGKNGWIVDQFPRRGYGRRNLEDDFHYYFFKEGKNAYQATIEGPSGQKN